MSTSEDLALLRRYEPVFRYTRGEGFFPMDVAAYVAACSLWRYHPSEGAACLVPRGNLSLEDLAGPWRGNADTTLFLRFVQPLDIPALIRSLQQEPREARAFRPGRGRLARVGYTSRFLDLLFSLTLLARGRVPGATSAAAGIEYRRLVGEPDRHRYYGRVVREQGWTILQYWYFYAFNNWRTGFFGVNDHEADWEMACLYLYPGEGGVLRPEWVALASHDYSGDDLRRRWDDPDVQKVGDHPVVYAGAGSHAGYYEPGEYIMEVELPFVSPLARLAERARDSWRRALGGGRQWRPYEGRGFSLLRVPFVDYAQGNGLAIGPGQERVWAEPVLLTPTPDWVSEYRGLWGLYARDPISGENAPGGPMYNRDGTIRRAWYDPLGWAGLQKVAAPNVAATRVAERRAHLAERREALDAAIAETRRELEGVSLEAAAIRSQPHLLTLSATYRERIAGLSAELARLLQERAAGVAVADALEHYGERLESGYRGPLRAHLRRPLKPYSGQQLRTGRVVEGWAAVSVGLLMIGTVTLTLVYREHIILGLAALLFLFALVEFSVRGRLMRFIDTVAILLACACGLVLVWEFFWTLVTVAVVSTGAYVIWANVRELRA